MMDVCAKPFERRRALSLRSPEKIAVAYIGLGWKKYLGAEPEALQEVVVSPTIGSNPFAINELIEEIGVENVYLLDNLHSKFYLCGDAVLVGSNNFSNNGFADNGSYEVSLLIDTKKVVKQFDELFESYKTLSLIEYSTTESKLSRLEQHRRDWERARHHGYNSDCFDVIENDRLEQSISLSNFSGSTKGIRVVWYESDSKLEYNHDVFVPDETVLNEVVFASEDDIHEYDWILLWRCNKDGKPRKGGDITWVQVTRVIENAIQDDTYTTIAIEEKGAQVSLPPFNLDMKVKQAIRDNLSAGKYPNLLKNKDGTWDLSESDKEVSNFVAHIKGIL